MIVYHLAYPPTVNGLFFNTKGGRVKTRQYTSWIQEASYAILEQGRKRLRGPVSVSIALVKPDKRRRDLDNTLKAVVDILVRMAVIEDDEMVERIEAQWMRAGHACAVSVKPWKEPK